MNADSQILRTIFTLPLLSLLTLMLPTGLVSGSEPPAPVEVTWDSPSPDATGSMPLGNGDVALNAWVEPAGDLVLLLSKANAWDGNGLLLKLGRVRIALEDMPLSAEPFRQTLRTGSGDILISSGTGPTASTLRLWVDANAPVIHVEAKAGRPVRMTAALESWRTAPRRKDQVIVNPKTHKSYTSGLDTSDPMNSMGGLAPLPTIIAPDIIVPDLPGQIRWYHRNDLNPDDFYPLAMRTQGLGEFAAAHPHPVRNRIVGAAMGGTGWTSAGPTRIRSDAAQRVSLAITVLSQNPSTPEGWNQALDTMRAAPADPTAATRHAQWWASFWQRSWIRIASHGPETDALRRLVDAYALQRFMNACAGRGEHPIKFNGSLFSLGTPADPDQRNWGPAYWFQNNRLVYWPMLADGDSDLMEPFFRMYRDMLPALIERTRRQFKHGGAYFSETMPFWGGQPGKDYGWQPMEERKSPLATNSYVTYYWQSGLELLLMMLDHQAYFPDETFLTQTLLPHAEAVLEFYRAHYPPGPDGRIRMEPSASLETWHSATNPAPEIVGIQTVVNRLLALPGTVTGAERRQAWTALRDSLPPIPKGLLRTHRDTCRKVLPKRVHELVFTADLHDPLRPTTGAVWNRMLAADPQTEILFPADTYSRYANHENCELYAVFPYRHFGLGQQALDLARRTFAARLHPGCSSGRTRVGCWHQDDFQAALLGLVNEAKAWVLDRASDDHHSSRRFPTLWDANHDENPDMDHGGGLQLTLQFMLMQCAGDRILLRPSWPADWDCRFRLHAPQRTVIEAEISGGALRIISVDPESRRKDIVDWAAQAR